MIINKPESSEIVNVMPNNQKLGNIKIEEKDNTDYINVHKMMVELSVKKT